VCFFKFFIFVLEIVKFQNLFNCFFEAGFQESRIPESGLPGATWAAWGYLGCLGLPGATWGYLGLPGATWGYLKLPGVPGATWGYLGLLGAT
jgi:hypothetical protein